MRGGGRGRCWWGIDRVEDEGGGRGRGAGGEASGCVLEVRIMTCVRACVHPGKDDVAVALSLTAGV